MSPKNPFANVGLAALGWLGLALLCGPSAGADRDPPAAAAVQSPVPTVLTLYDGKVYQGKIQVDDTGYSVVQNGGVLRFRKDLVEGAFGSLEEAYRFKAARVPARDPDERFKLARWCLTHGLNAEAREQLAAVLELSPGNVQIQNMIVNIDNAARRAAFRDDALVRTGGVGAPSPSAVSDGATASPPGELDPRVVRSGRPLGAAGLPVIFDLPTTQAVLRADEFTRDISPILNRACARCHNEKYQGDFQLIPVKTRRDLTPSVARANLEAALRAVDPESPARSELLTRSLVPHGPSQRPIFRGATDPDYQRVAAWVRSLRRSAVSEPSPSQSLAPPASWTPPRFGPAEAGPSPSPAADSGGFATERNRPSVLPGATPPAAAGAGDGRPAAPASPNPVTPAPPGQFLAGSGSGMQPYAPPNTDFPVPYMMGGPRPKPAETPGQARPQAQAQAKPMGPAPAELPPLPGPSPAPPATAAPASPSPPATKAVAAPTPKPARKPVQIDPALLERALMNRYTTPQ
jgi:hypothetical protein